MTKHRQNGDELLRDQGSRLAVLNSPLLNKGTAFTAEERKALGLTGLLPPDISTLETQVKRAYIQYERLPDALSKNIYLTALHDRNEVLFYRLFSEHLREMIPIVNDLTVGMAMEQYHHECRRPRGVYLSIDHAEAIEEAFANLGAGPGDIDLILATDAEQILGIGDWGVGGIEVSIGKLAIYTAAGGIDPTRVIPVMLDVGTNRESLLSDPTYIGNRHARIRGERYDAFIDAYVKAVTKLFPNACCSGRTSRRAMDGASSRSTATGSAPSTTICRAPARSRWRRRSPPCASAGRRCATSAWSSSEPGTAGIGIADQIRDAMVREGLSKEDAARRFWCVDRQGLLTTDMAGQLHDYQVPYARPAAESKAGSTTGNGNGVRLAEVVRRVKPTMLIGASTVAGSFTEAIVREMAAHTERPIIFALSNPPARAEANPADLIAWTDGRALIATGSPFAPVTYKGLTYVIGQVNNAMLYPGLASARSSREPAGSATVCSRRRPARCPAW
jgi:malate dehydrogenase (oxaloacetate-decarboxylating)